MTSSEYKFVQQLYESKWEKLTTKIKNIRQEVSEELLNQSSTLQRQHTRLIGPSNKIENNSHQEEQSEEGKEMKEDNSDIESSSQESENNLKMVMEEQ